MNKPLEIFGRDMMDKKRLLLPKICTIGADLCVRPQKPPCKGSYTPTLIYSVIGQAHRPAPYNAIGATLCGRP